jgi:hypothetical protein
LNSNYDTANPLVQNEASTSKKRSRMYSVNAGIEFDLFKYFTWRTAGSYTWSSSKSDSFADHNSTSYLMDPKNTGINGSIGNDESYKWQITNTLNYHQTFSQKHKLDVLLGHEASYSESEGNSMKLRQFPYPNFGLDNIANATVYEKSVSHKHSGIVSAFAVLTIILMNDICLLLLSVPMVLLNLLTVIDGAFSLLHQLHGVFLKKASLKKVV